MNKVSIYTYVGIIISKNVPVDYLSAGHKNYIFTNYEYIIKKFINELTIFDLSIVNEICNRYYEPLDNIDFIGSNFVITINNKKDIHKICIDCMKLELNLENKIDGIYKDMLLDIISNGIKINLDNREII